MEMLLFILLSSSECTASFSLYNLSCQKALQEQGLKNDYVSSVAGRRGLAPYALQRKVNVRERESCAQTLAAQQIG